MKAATNGILTSTQRMRIQLILREMTQRELALRIGCHEKTVSDVIAGRRSTLWVRVAIARELGFELGELWPDAARGRAPQNTSRF